MRTYAILGGILVLTAVSSIAGSVLLTGLFFRIFVGFLLAAVFLTIVQ